MKKPQTDLYNSFQSFQKKQEKIRPLSEIDDILNFFHNKTYRKYKKTTKTLNYSGIALPFVLAGTSALFNSPSKIIFTFGIMYIFYLSLLSLYLYSNRSKFGRQDDIITSYCKESPDWSEKALKSALKIITSLQPAYEKRLSVFKLICAAVTFLIVLLMNQITDIHLNLLKFNLENDTLSMIIFIVISLSITILTMSYIEFWTLVYYIDHCSVMAISIEFLISVSEETKTSSTPFYNHKNNQ